MVNALWDLAAKRAGKPLWALLAEMSPEELVELVDFRYLTDALTPDEALEILRRAEPGRAERTARLLADGYPAYTTTPGWLGYSDAKLTRLCAEAVAAGYTQIKLKVGADLEDDVRRLRIARAVCGPDIRIAVDANQRWDVGDAIALDPGARAVRRRGGSRSRRAPTTCSATPPSGARCSPIRVATGEHVQNRVVFKQLMQAEAIDVVQIDAAPGRRASTRTSPSCCSPRSSGCRSARTPAASACASWSSTWRCSTTSPCPAALEDRVIEYVDHLHEHFVDPVVIRDARYRAPTAPGFSAEMTADAIAAHRFPGGAVWTEPAMQS